MGQGITILDIMPIDDRPERDTLWFQQYSNPQLVQGLLPMMEPDSAPATEDEIEVFFQKLRELCAEGKEAV